eukprot:74330-Amorphochlora_amoeboformis.AAC.1
MSLWICDGGESCQPWVNSNSANTIVCIGSHMKNRSLGIPSVLHASEQLLYHYMNCLYTYERLNFSGFVPLQQYPQDKSIIQSAYTLGLNAAAAALATPQPPTRKRGRPAGAKNKAKTHSIRSEAKGKR